MKRWRYLLCALLLSLSAHGTIDPTQVIVLTNSQIPEGEKIARTLMEHRGIPSQNLISLPMPTTEAVTWEQFSQSILNPLRARLIESHQLTGKLSSEIDSHHRQAFVPTGSPTVKWIVTCFGVPLKINTQELPKMLNSKTRSIQGDQASVDSELTVIANTNLDPNGAFSNPWFGKAKPEDAEVEGFVRVTRLDGPTAEIVLRNLQTTWQAETRGLQGRAYIDLGGPYAEGDQWFKQAQELLKEASWSISVENTPAVFTNATRSDAPAFYLGWYREKPEGSFGEKSTVLAPGAIALHIHSFSASTLRHPESCWTPWLIQQGAGLTFGNVHEPFLSLTTRPDLVVKGLQQGLTAGEAAWYATPFMSWQNVIIGDPFYEPFAVKLEDQLKHFRMNPDRLGAYALLREIETIPVHLKINELSLANQHFPCLALQLALAQMEVEQKQPIDWPSTPPKVWHDENPGLMREAIDFLKKQGKNESADALQALLNQPR